MTNAALEVRAAFERFGMACASFGWCRLSSAIRGVARNCMRLWGFLKELFYQIAAYAAFYAFFGMFPHPWNIIGVVIAALLFLFVVMIVNWPRRKAERKDKM